MREVGGPPVNAAGAIGNKLGCVAVLVDEAERLILPHERIQEGGFPEPDCPMQ
jgi:hypothetical protein